MGLFNFFKPKEHPIDEVWAKMLNDICPKGIKDIKSGAFELYNILNNRIDFKAAKTIFLRSAILSRTTDPFDEYRLRQYLSCYRFQRFSDNQVKKFYSYLFALTAAMIMYRATPSEVYRDGNQYVW